MKGNKGKILVAVDGSDNSFESVEYIAGVPSFKTVHIILYNVLSKVPEYYYDVVEGWTPISSRIREIRAWEISNEQEIKKFAEKGKGYLLDKGFLDEKIEILIRERQKGIARDITEESKKGYAAVVVGRKGIGNLEDTLFGSISLKLLERITFTPLIVVGKKPVPGKVLIGLDGSEGSMKAVKYVGTMLGDSDSEIKLVHVIRGEDPVYQEELEKRMISFFESSENKLLKAGFKAGSISVKLITKARSRAAALIQEANESQFDTIVVGRRGLSKVKSFFMGRVSNKVVQLAKNKAVWVVS